MDNWALLIDEKIIVLFIKKLFYLILTNKTPMMRTNLKVFNIL